MPVISSLVSGAISILICSFGLPNVRMTVLTQYKYVYYVFTYVYLLIT